MISKERLIQDALEKDLGQIGDVTSEALVNPDLLTQADLVVKAETGIISGLDVFKLVFNLVDDNIEVRLNNHNGDQVNFGDVVATLSGPAKGILRGERVALEFTRRMSGIATKTAEFVKAVDGTDTIILDTRKILPCFGELDKEAVRDGGGTNHRANLSEMGLIKNNHLDLIGIGINEAVKAFKEKYPEIPVEVEVRDRGELLQAFEGLPDRIMLDNFTNEEIEDAVSLRAQIAPQIPLEVSGNMDLERVAQVAQLGVEFISVGELTHSVKAFDLSLHIHD